MEWYNEPPVWRDEESGLRVTTAPDSEFWRVTHYGFVRDTGHLRYRTVAGDATAEVWVRGAYHDRYDQAGLMIRIDARHWIKGGIELVAGVQHVSAVVTREFSDWSVRPLPDPPTDLRLTLSRRGDSVKIHYALDDGPLTLLRLAYFPPGLAAQLGVMAASPQGQGFTVSFRGLRMDAGEPGLGSVVDAPGSA